jgi:cell division protease FtsH
MAKNQRLPVFVLIAILVATVLVVQGRLGEGGTVRLPYSEFLALVDEGAVAEVEVSGDRIAGRFVDPREGRSRFVTHRVEPGLSERLEDAGVEHLGRPSETLFSRLLIGFLPFLLLIGFWIFMMRRMAGRGGPGVMNIGKSKAKVYVEDDTKVSFQDVAGVDEAKEELAELVEFLKAPQHYGRLGARMPRGVLLVGPPGTGKTLLARAVAGEAGVPFFSISGSEFVEMFVGVGAARVRDLFAEARTKAPCIVFIDELDALGRARGNAGAMGGHDEKEQTLNQLLVEMDGFDTSTGIVLLAATNRPEVLDPALLRAGRFDRQVLVDRPDKAGRAAIVDVHLASVQLDPDVSVEEVAELTPGFSGAELANLVNEAALVATRRGAERVAIRDFTVAVERIVAGLEKKNRLLNPREREIVAHHELGHAIVASALPSPDPVHKISIIPRGIGALGYTMQRPTEDRFLMTREELEEKLAVLLGGRAAEKVVYGHLSTGASDDLARAGEIARSMVTRYAMVPELGNVTFAEDRPNLLGVPGLGSAPRPYSDRTARGIDAAVRSLVDSALARAEEILRTHRVLLDEGARQLLERETLERGDLEALFAELQAPSEAA